MHIKVGTRGSKLALMQTQSVVDTLSKAHPELSFEIVVIHTKGDKNSRPLCEIGGNGLFIKEIEQQLLKDKIQMAIHSMKDLPSELEPHLTISKCWKREDNHDCLILNHERSLSQLKQGATIATGSIRRKKQLLKLRPDLNVVDIRGNIDTRIQKMKDNDYDGLILAKAGCNRLHINETIEVLSYEQMIPSCCQGALAIELKADNVDLINIVNEFCDEKSDIETSCERYFLQEMNGNCKNPIGACASYQDGIISLQAVYGKEQLYYASISGTDAYQVAIQAAKQIRKQMAGTVSLVGAGPGSLDYLTIQAVKKIKEADCILYDRLVPEQVFSFGKEDCEWIYVGKASHQHTLKQEQINALMVQKAMEYKNVVRLKGGDVFVFGRGQEEVEYLKEKGISYEVVCGISSCIAAPSSAGIPLTTRGVSNGFHVMSAHNATGEFKNIDFENIAKSKDTLVFLMGLSKAKEIAQKLMEHGMDSNMPIAIISCATTPYQKNLYSTLSDIQNIDIGLVSPAIIVVGKCVSFHETRTLSKAMKKELFFPCHEKNQLTKLLSDYKVYEVKVAQIELLPYKLDHIPDIVIFTSKNAVDGFFFGIDDIRKYCHTQFVVVGKATATRLQSYGIKADFIPSCFNAKTLIEELKVNKTDIVDYFSSDIHDEIDGLESVCEYHKIVVYHNSEIECENMYIAHPVIFTSSLNAKRFLKHVSNIEEYKEKGIAYSIGPKTTQTLKEYGIKHILQANEATFQSLKELIDEN